MDYKGYVIHHNTNRDVCAVISGDKVLAVVGTIEAAKGLVDSYIEGQKLVADTNTKSIQEVAGGAERYGELVEWASKNLSEAEQKVFNDMVDSGDVETAKFAVQGLMSKANVNYNPNQPELFEGTSDVVSADAYQSVSQVTDAMNDPRYEKDPSFRKEVEDKLARSKVI